MAQSPAPAAAMARTLLVAGLGEGFGLALCTAFASAGFDVIGLARSSALEKAAADLVTSRGRAYRHIACDLTDAAALEAAIGPVASEIAVAVYAAHAFMMAPFNETKAEDFLRLFSVNCLGAANMAQILLPAMLERRAGTLIFAGATASLRGGPRFAALAASKFALRGLSQSLARAYGPKGIHVAHLVIDGVIDEPQSDLRLPGLKGAKLTPKALAANCLALSRQSPDALTFELDIRPATENF